MANKSKKSAYYWFMLEILEDNKQKGHPIHGGMASVAQLAKPRWNEMTAAQRKPYEDKALAFKNSVPKFDNKHNLIHLRTDPLLEYEVARAKEIENVVASWPEDLSGLSAVKFCCIDFQILGKVEFDNGSSTVYLPAEVAVIEFSLRDGITNTFHEFLRPPPIPTGSRYTCQLHSGNTHQIPLDGCQGCTDDYSSLYERIMSFVNVDGAQGTPNHFYVPMANYDSTVYCLEWLHSKAHPDCEEEPPQPYELEGLLMALTLKGTKKAISKTMASERLCTSEFQYVGGMKCSYHDKIECNHCSLAFVRQYCYSTFQLLCNYYKIQVTWRHEPHDSSDDSRAAVASGPNRPTTTSEWQEPKGRQRQPLQKPCFAQQPSAGPRLPASGTNPWAPLAGTHNLSRTMESIKITDDFPPIGSQSIANEVGGGATANTGARAAISDAAAVHHGYHADLPMRPHSGMRPPPDFGDSSWPRVGRAFQDSTPHPHGDQRAPASPVRPTAPGTGRGNAADRQSNGRSGGDFLDSDSFSLWKKE